tara:strand:+ start:81 stop:323 length:243 start_codon:yes stop_codon:yes gene_type:complete
MESQIIKILEKKIDEIKAENPKINVIIQEFDTLDSHTLSSGIIIGRLFNSFYYQHRRILKRSPNESEFEEFIKFLKNRLD